MAWMDARIEVVGCVAGEAVALNRGPLPLSVAQMAFGAIGQRVHARQRESRSAMDFKRLEVIPSSRRMAAVTSPAQPFLVWIFVTRSALPRHAPLTAMTLIAGSGLVSPCEGEAGAGMVEAFA